MRAISILVLTAVASACAPAVGARFRDAPVVWKMNDDQDIAKPRERVVHASEQIANAAIFDPMVRAFDHRRKRPAANVNALDEVPDSTWWQNRISARRMTPAEVVRGPDVDGLPVPPLRVVSAKKEGTNPGFLMADSRGKRYLVKFDTIANPEQQTASNVIVNRILWALGYNVPADYVFFFRRDQLRLDPELAARGIGEADIDRILSGATRRSDGAFRATASQYLEGVPVGGFAPRGTRSDDPNDVIPHQHRRELRGMRVFAAWLGHTDMKDNNTLDMYVERDGRRYLVHYLLDFGEALGGHQSEKDQPQVGWEYFFDWAAQSRALVSFGLWTRPWEGQEKTPWPAIGYFGASHFDPDTWKARYPYEPFRYMDRADAFWAAKLVMRFDRAMIEATVAAGALGDPAAASYLADALILRRDMIGATYFGRVTPLDEFTIRGAKLCFVDLARRHQFHPDGVVILDDGHRRRRIAMTERGETCVGLPSDDSYNVWRLSVQRRRNTSPPMELHLRGGSTPRILGIIH